VRPVRIVVGLVVWALLVALGVHASGEGAGERLARFAVTDYRIVEARLPLRADLRRGDPVFVSDPERCLVRVGRVEAVREEDGARIAALAIYPSRSDLLAEGARATAFDVALTAGWVARTLLPEERLAEIRGIVRRFLAEEGDAIGRALWPEAKRALREVVELLGAQLPDALRARSEDWEALWRRHRDGVVKAKLVPVLEEAVLDRAEERLEPLLEEVGEELWRALPVWSLGLRYVWERVPGTEEDQVRERFHEFLEGDAARILARHAPEAGRIAAQVLREAAADERGRKAVGEVARTVAADPRLEALLRDLARELLLENERLRDLVERRWEEGLGDAVGRAAGRLEPVLRRIKDRVALNEGRDGINPRLARVLRAGVLRKDVRWVLLEGGDGAPLADGARIPGGVGRE